MLNSCKNVSSFSISGQPAGTLQMIDSINAIYSRTNFMMHPYEKDSTMKAFRAMISANQTGSVEQVFTMATEFMKGGDNETCIKLVNQIIKAVPSFNVVNDQSKLLYQLLAISNLRMGEIQNCINNHNEESCIFPIKGKGIHTDKRGSEASIEILEKILNVYPNDLQSRYLLNLAHMTLGTYPNGVNKKWVVSPRVFASGMDFPKFNNIASKLGMDVNDLAGSVVTEDFDNDGDMDLMVSTWAMKSQIKYFNNNGDGMFVDVTERALLKNLSGGLNMQQADFDNDGFMDVLVLRGGWYNLQRLGILPNSLLRNRGDGTFEDVTFKAGIYTTHPTQTATWFDYDNDGNLDLFIGNEKIKTANEHHPSEFYHNNGDGTFKDMAKQYGMEIFGFVKGVKAGDINNDGLMDIYISRMDGDNMLFVNEGGTTPDNWRFTEQASQAGVTLPFYSFPTWFFDFNNDGYEDIFVGSYDSLAPKNMAAQTLADWLGKPFGAEPCILYMNNKNSTFTNVTKSIGLNHVLQPMGSNFGDFNNDGYLDFYLGTGAPDLASVVPNRMFINVNGTKFVDVTTASGTGNVQKGHAVSIADLDNDGDLDIYAKMGGAYTGDRAPDCVFENPGFENKFLVLKLEGKKANRCALGAKVKIQYTDNSNKQHVCYHVISTGASFGANSIQLEAGLGKAKKIDFVEITWPNKQLTKQTIQNLGLDKKYLIVEGEAAVEVAYKKIEFMDHSGAHHHNM